MEPVEYVHWLELPAGTKKVVFGRLPELIARALQPVIDPQNELQEIAQAVVEMEWESKLRDDVRADELKVKDAIRLEPHPLPLGAALNAAVVLLPDLRAYLDAHHIGIRFATSSDAATPAPAGGVIGLSLAAPAPSASGATETTEARRGRRWTRFQALGGLLESAGGGKFRLAGQHGALAELAREEKAAGRPMADRNDVRRDLITYADAERAKAKRGANEEQIGS